MHKWQSLPCAMGVQVSRGHHTKVPAQSLLWELRRQIGVILRELCRQRGVELLEGHCMADHIHMCLSIPPKLSTVWRIR